MPTYEYECPACGRTASAFRHVDQRHDGPECHGQMDKLISRPMVVTDLPGYQSPVTGKWIEGKKARTEDLKRTGSRPWEGMDVEKREAAKARNEADAKLDAVMEAGIMNTLSHMDSVKQKALLS
jgi:putative FmdB family regulatory protein